MVRGLFLALVLFADVAFARTVVIVDRPTSATSATSAYSINLARNSGDLARSYVTGMLDRLNPGSYDVIAIDGVKTEWARTGLINGTQYDAVIWAGYQQVVPASNPHALCYPCSLTLAARAPTVPQLFVESGTGENNFVNSTSCSTGFTGESSDPGGQGPHHDAMVVMLNGTPLRWRAPWLTASRNATQPAGSMRPILKASEARTDAATPPVDRDSVLSDADVHALYGQSTDYYGFAGIRYMDHVSGAKPIIFARWGQTALTMLGGSADPDDQHNNGTPLTIWACMALLDSASGGAVFGDSPRSIRLGIQISGLAARGSSIGILPHDTTAVFASLDSIGALRVPVAFGVNIDSAQTYLRDVRKAASISFARFTPENRSGTYTGAATGTASRMLPRDLWGAQRTRQFVGPVNTTAADTSLKALAIASFWRIDSIFGEGRRSGMAMPPAGDWSPSGMTDQAATNRDSLVLAAYQGGFSGISFNIESDTLTTSIGFRQGQGMASAAGVGAFTFAAYPGTLAGGTSQVYNNAGGEVYVHDYVTRVLRGSVMSFWKQPQRRDLYLAGEVFDGTTELLVSSNAQINRPCNIARISMCELGTGSYSSSPARPGFYVIKYLKHYTDAVNMLAGRNIFQIVYPEQLTGADLSR